MEIQTFNCDLAEISVRNWKHHMSIADAGMSRASVLPRISAQGNIALYRRWIERKEKNNSDQISEQTM